MTDEVLLGRLLDHSDDLTVAEEKAFKSMSAIGKKLSPKQRDWAMAVYDELDLQKHYLADKAELESKKGRRGQVPKAKDPPAQTYWWESAAHHPTKPPGK